jgi:4-aminobutyrate aminotransferase-like enzyme
VTRPRQSELLRREAAWLAPGATDEAAAGERVFETGAGSTLVDVDGNAYLDFAAGASTQSLGHCHPEVVAALVHQAGRLWNVHDTATADRAQLCELLGDLLPDDLDTFAFFSTGAEVVEAALRVVAAVAPPGRNRLGALRHGFHGKTMGARMLVHWDIGYQSFAGNSILGYAPYCYRCPLGLEYPSCGTKCADLVVQHVASKPNVCALVFEPVQGAAGVIVPPPEYWPKIVAACRENGVLLVADEVLTGGGRAGEFLASTLLGIEPDLVLLAKGMASGFPFAALAGRSAVLRRPEIAAAGSTASTFGGNPLGIATALATLNVLARDGLVARAAELGTVLTERLAPLPDRYAVVGEVRGVGLLHGVELVHDPETRAPAPDLARDVYRAALDLGLRVALGGNVLRITPPFTIERDELERGVELLDRALARVAEGRR